VGPNQVVTVAFEIESSKTFEVRYYVTNAPGDGLGMSANTGTYNYHTNVFIRRVNNQ
jgi:hypothetical protein